MGKENTRKLESEITKEARTRTRRNRVAILDGPDPIDVYVGQRVKLRRLLMGISQQVLADGIGLTFQQVQKYEHGANRISASALHRIALALGVPVSFFFVGADSRDVTPPIGEEQWISRESRNLIQDYYASPDAVRKGVQDLLRATARTGGDEE